MSDVDYWLILTQEPDKTRTHPDDWNTDWSGMSSSRKKASDRGVRVFLLYSAHLFILIITGFLKWQTSGMSCGWNLRSFVAALTGGQVSHCSHEKAELRLEQLWLGCRWQLVQWEGRAGTELCGGGRMGQRLGRGRRRRDFDKHVAPAAWRRAVSQRLQLGQRSSRGSESERSVCQPLPEKYTWKHGERGVVLWTLNMDRNLSF